MPYLTHHLGVVYMKKEGHHLGHKIHPLFQGQDQLLQHLRDQSLPPTFATSHTTRTRTDTFCLDRRSISISLQHTSLQRLFPGATLSTSLPCSRTRRSSSDITTSHDVDTSSSIAVLYSNARAYGSSARVDLCYALHPRRSPLLVLDVHLYLKF